MIECKVLRGSRRETVRRGLRQTARYMERCAARSGHLVVFDRREGRSWDDKIFRCDESAGGRAITVWGM